MITYRTECERILSKGILPAPFLKEEIRCEFLVSEQLKKIWAIALDTLLEFDRVCRKHNLKYFLAYGSLLGAIRHRGFIPWDDDLDVLMFREDYDKLMKLGAEFKEPYFLQTPYSDPGYFFSYAKIRNSNTSCITTQFRYQRINWGQNFDIFPLDNICIDNGESYFDEISKLGLDLSNYMRSSNPNPKSDEEKKRISQYSGLPPFEIYDKLQCLAQKYNNCETDYIGVTTAYLYGFKKGTFYKKDFEEALEWNFEGVKSYVPVGYDRILKTIYGDYHKLPPIEKRGTWHNNIIYNPDVPYKILQAEVGIIY